MSSWTEDDLKTIEQAIASGSFEVEYSNGLRRRFRSVTELLRVRDLIREALGKNDDSRVSYARFSKGT